MKIKHNHEVVRERWWIYLNYEKLRYFLKEHTFLEGVDRLRKEHPFARIDVVHIVERGFTVE